MASFSYHRKVDPQTQQPLPPHPEDHSAPSPRTPTERWEGLKKVDIDPKGTMYKPGTISAIWVVSLIVLVVLVALDVTYEHHDHFGVDSTFGFHAWYGFLSCVGMVLVAKGLGWFLQRGDDFYDE